MVGNASNVDGCKDSEAYYDGPNIASEWVVNGIDAVVEASSATSNYTWPPIWGDHHHSIDVHSLGYCNIMNVVGTSASSSSMLPHNLPPLPSGSTDPDFIERFSCLSEIMSPFSFPATNMTDGELINEKKTVMSGVDDEKQLVGLKKRKRSKQKSVKQEDNGGDHGEKANGSGENVGGKEEGCIHVRARRGEATNSHSLAERMRREKISVRMKHLQDLVPGCNKVTGKAVMLDEIINYVQSLQRQVEFLSMKLATVDQFHTQGFSAKDILLPSLPPCISITMPFPSQSTRS